MLTKRLLVLTALILCCCIISLQASPRLGCKCLRANPNPINPRMIKKIEVFPISGYCRKTEIIVYRRNGSKTCVSPHDEGVRKLLENLQGKSQSVNLTSVSPAASTTNI